MGRDVKLNELKGRQLVRWREFVRCYFYLPILRQMLI
jgi:deoxyribodipyrimidine photolyase-like uncharacterized protein